VDICKRHTVKKIAEGNGAWAEKIKKIKNFARFWFFSVFQNNVDNRCRKWSIERKPGVTQHLAKLNPCIGITMPTVFAPWSVYISSSMCPLNAWRGRTLTDIATWNACPVRMRIKHFLKVCFDDDKSVYRDDTSIAVLWCKNICWGKLILNLTSDAIVVFILIKLAKQWFTPSSRAYQLGQANFHLSSL